MVVRRPAAQHSCGPSTLAESQCKHRPKVDAGAHQARGWWCMGTIIHGVGGVVMFMGGEMLVSPRPALPLPYTSAHRRGVTFHTDGTHTSRFSPLSSKAARSVTALPLEPPGELLLSSPPRTSAHARAFTHFATLPYYIFGPGNTSSGVVLPRTACHLARR
jgi:hypothetical protein